MRVAYFILGMHRSGTSAIASALHNLGVDFGESLLPASNDNPKGYFENQAVQAFNETLLVEQGYGWDDVHFDFETIEADHRKVLIANAKKIIVREFGVFQRFGIKDPRFCLLFPLWQEACSQLDIEVRVVLAYRHPIEVAQSLKARNDMSLQSGLALWCEYMTKAELYSREVERLCIDYNDLLTDFEQTAQRVLTFIGEKKKRNISAKAVIDKNLKHFQHTQESLVGVPSFVEKIFVEFVQGSLSAKVLDKCIDDFNDLKHFFFNANKHRLHRKFSEQRTKYKALKDDYYKKLQNSEQVRVNVEKKVQSQHDAIEKRDERIRHETEKNTQLNLATSELRHSRNLLEIDLKHATHNLSKLRSNKQKLEEDVLQLSRDREKLEEDALQLSRDREKLRENIREIEIDRLALKSQIKTALADYETVVDANNKLTQSQDELLTANQALIKDLASQDELNTGQLKQIEGLQSKLNRCESDIRTQTAEHSRKLEKLVAEFRDDKQIIKDQLKSAHKQALERALHDERLRLIQQVNQSFQQWFELIVSPLSRLSANFSDKNATQSFIAARLSAALFSRRLERASGKFIEAFETAKQIPISFIANFDEAGYLAANEDLQVAFEAEEFSDGLEHFLYFGFSEALRGQRKIHPKKRFFSASCAETANQEFHDYLAHFYDFPAIPVSNTGVTADGPLKVKELAREHVNKTDLRSSPAAFARPAPNHISRLNLAVSVDIILPVYNALDDVKACISSLYESQTIPFNLIVIDDCSEHETQVWLVEEQKVRGFQLFRNTENLRFTKTVNRGFSESHGDYVVLLNSDTIVTAFWLEKILACFQSDPSTGIVGPLSNAASWQTVPVREDKVNGGWLVNEIPPGYSIEMMGQLVETVSKRQYPDVPSVNGFCYVIKRSVINNIGTLDEEYFPTGYGEEDDFSIRARKAGFTIRVADDTYVFHAKSKSYTQEVRKVLTVGGRKSLDKKHGKAEIEKLIAAWKSEPCLPEIGFHIESFMHVSSGNKKVVYTAIFGNYDNLKTHEYINPDWDYVCFTDNQALTSDVFTVKHVPCLFENTTKNARMIKILSHLFLIGFDYSLWIDGSVKLRGRNINELIHENLSTHYISLHSHVKRNCVYEEEEACSQSNKDGADVLSAQVNFYRNQGMPAEAGLFETAEIARDQRSADVQALNSNWWQVLDSYSIRDQISLPYVFWQHGFTNHFMQGNQWLDAYFHMYKHNGDAIQHKTPVEIVLPVTDQNTHIASLISQIFTTTMYPSFSVTVLTSKSVSVDNQQISELLTEYGERLRIENINRRLTSSEVSDFIKQGKSELCCLVSEDLTLFNSDWLMMLVDGLRKDPNATIAGPSILSEDFEFIASGLRFKRTKGQVVKVYNSRKLGGTGTVQAVHQACVLLDRQHFKSIKGFDPQFTDFRSAVVELCHRNAQNKKHSQLVLNSEVVVSKDDEALDSPDLLFKVLSC